MDLNSDLGESFGRWVLGDDEQCVVFDAPHDVDAIRGGAVDFPKSAERAGRARETERAEIAAHLHDSVLQTLSLVQRRIDDRAEVLRLGDTVLSIPTLLMAILGSLELAAPKVADLPRVLHEAFHIATSGRPGPVVVDIPKDVSVKTAPFEYPADVEMRSYNPVRKGHGGQIRKAVQLILQAKRPYIYTGGGVILGNASAELRELVDMLGLPCTNTLMGLGAMFALLGTVLSRALRHYRASGSALSVGCLILVLVPMNVGLLEPYLYRQHEFMLMWLVMLGVSIRSHLPPFVVPAPVRHESLDVNESR